jgi:transposase
MEIIAGVERRRQWRDEEKLRILAELDEPGIKFSAVARRHDIGRSLLWQWRDARRRGRLVAETPAFVPLQVVPERSAPEAQKGPDPTRCVGPPEPDGRVEIVLPDGTAVRAPETISAAALRRVLAALRG